MLAVPCDGFEFEETVRAGRAAAGVELRAEACLLRADFLPLAARQGGVICEGGLEFAGFEQPCDFRGNGLHLTGRGVEPGLDLLFHLASSGALSSRACVFCAGLWLR